jgi:hypothetical protein
MPWEDPWPCLDDLCGRYAVLFLAGSRLRAAHDAFGSRSLFYTPRHHAMASHAKLLAVAYDLPPSEPVARFMERKEYLARTVKYLPGDITAFAHVHALVPNNHWDGETTRRHWPRALRPAGDEESFHTEIRAHFSTFRSFVESRYTPVFGVTGGIDSRAAFAAFHGRFRGTTWTQHLAERERPVIREIVDYLSLDHAFITSRGQRPGKISNVAGASSGDLRPGGGHLLSEAIAAAYPETGHVFIRGYGGEILRGFPPYQNMADLSTSSMRKAYNSSIRKCGRKDPVYTAFCDEQFEGFRRRGNYDGLEAFGYSPMDHFYWEHRMGMWGAAMLNEMDPAMYGLVGFNGRRLFDAAFGLPDHVRLTKRLLASVVGLYDEGLAAIPYT